MKTIHAFLLLSFLSVRAVAQPVYSSSFIDEPESLVDYVRDCAEFWSAVEDLLYGGYFTSIGRSGNIISQATKGMVSQSRDAYGFTRAFMLTGDEAYLDNARSALDFMYEYLWDTTYGGWYARSQRNGSQPFTGTKTAFDQHYALLGITASFEATGDSSDWEMLTRGYDFIEDHLWDSSSLTFGYFHQTNRQGTAPEDKSFNSTVDAITTHLYSLYLQTGDQKYYDRLMQLKRNIIDRLIASMEDQVIGFAEHYNSDWTVDESQDRTIMGHILKTAWCLARIYRIQAEEESLDGAELLVQEVLEKAYDHEYGGPYKDYIRTTGEMLMYGAFDTAKAWWQMEQAVMAGFLLFEITWEPEYLEMADESLDFFMRYFVDPQYGEVYADRSRDGGRVAYSGGFWDENKGSEFKAAYHSIETGYESYLYSKLLVKQEPVTLYYRYAGEENDRTLRFNPLAVDFDKLRIVDVRLDGAPYPDFDSTARLVTIPALTSGIFAVTYFMEDLGPVKPVFVSGVRENTLRVGLYPNPASGSVKLELPAKGKTIVFVSDQAGRQILSAVSELPLYELDIRDLAPGIYTVRFQNGRESAAKLLVVN